MIRSSMAMARVLRHVAAAAALTLLAAIAFFVFYKPAPRHASSLGGTALFAPQGGGSDSTSPASTAQPLPDVSQLNLARLAERDDGIASIESVEEPIERDDFDYATHLQFEERYAQQVSAYEQAVDAGFSAIPGDLLDIKMSDEMSPESDEQRRHEQHEQMEQSYLEYTSLYDQAAEAGAPMLMATPPLDVLASPHDQALYQIQQEAESSYSEQIDASAADPLFFAQSAEYQVIDPGVPDFVDPGVPDFSDQIDKSADVPDAGATPVTH